MSTGDLRGAPFPGPWRARGACRRVPAAIFFPTRGDDVDAARAVCRACPVVEECRAYALGVPGLKGVWGGLSERERERFGQDADVGDDGRQEEAQPPGEGAVRAQRGTLLAALKVVATRPGAWARVGRFASVHSGAATASQLRTGRRAVLPGRWRFEGRRNDDGTSELWARYEGPELA